jgi:hypothetical protein
MEQKDFDSFMHHNELFYKEFTKAIKTIKDALWPERSDYIEIGRYITEEYAKEEYGSHWKEHVGSIEINTSAPSGCGCCPNDEFAEEIPASIVLGNGVENYIDKVKADRKKIKKEAERKKKEEEQEKARKREEDKYKLYLKLKKEFELEEVEIKNND